LGIGVIRMSRKKTEISESKRTFNIILSFVVAFFLWAYVIGEVNPTTQETITNVPVQLLNVQSLTARQLAIAGDGKYTVDVVVEGKRRDILNVSIDEIVAEADLFGWSKGENYIPVRVSVPDPLDIVDVRSPRIEVKIEDLIALSKPVKVIYRGEIPEGYEVGSIVAKPSQIEVTGARSEVGTVDEVQVSIDIDDLTQDGVTLQGNAVPVNFAGVEVDNVNLSANTVDVFARMLKLKEVELVTELVGGLPDGYGAEVQVLKTIKIKGGEEAIKDLETVTAEPIDVSDITEEADLPLSIILPDGVELANGFENIIARVTILPVSEKELNYSVDEVNLEGLTRGKSVNTRIDTIDLVVKGRKEIIDGLSKDKFELFIDVSGLDKGNHIVEIQVIYDVNLHSIAVIPDKMDIIILETEQENANE
jgi:YbbR domain-containing protein